MSLINEALKKAQRQREAQAAPAAPGSAAPVNSTSIAKRGRAMSTQSVLLLGAAATVLVVFSVVFTVFYLNRPAPSLATPAPAAPTPAATDAPSPVIVAPVLPRPVPEPAPPVASSSAPPSPSVTSPAPTASTATPPAVASRPVSPAPAPPSVATPPTHDPRVQAFVDALRIAGIRSSGTDSKVLMNDRVYRVNDLVDRSLGVKLVRVEPSVLTFVDAQGLAYTKNF